MLVSKNTIEIKAQLHEQFGHLLSFVESLNNEDWTSTINDLIQAVDDPFMFVIVGEVKAGKSSFINALLATGKEICKVAPSPMTDTIQQIVYGEQESEVSIGKYVKRIYQPIDILKQIAIVDTPGTNTIINHHQEITESFIPSSDLIVFVFEAKNPYRQSAWEFFDFIHSEWHKKIIFVLQQKDLLSQTDLEINIEGVRQQARSKGIMEANVYAVSAMLELNGNQEESGFLPLRQYIKENVTGEKASYTKLLNLIITSEQITNKINLALDLRRRQLVADKAFRADIQEKLNEQVNKSNRFSQLLIENLIACYERVMKTRREILSENIGFSSLLKRSFGSFFNSQNNLKTWLSEFNQEVEKTLQKEFQSRLDEGILDISSSIQDMAKMVDSKIRTSETILKDNHEIFADIAEKRAFVIQDLQRTFKNFLENSENFYTDDINQKTQAIIPDFAKGSGLAIVGVIITTITNAAVFDITGGVIAALGLSFAGISVGLSRNKILKSFDITAEDGKQRIEGELSRELNNYANKIKDKIEDNFYNFDKHLMEESEKIKNLDNNIKSFSDALMTEKIKIQSLL